MMSVAQVSFIEDPWWAPRTDQKVHVCVPPTRAGGLRNLSIFIKIYGG